MKTKFNCPHCNVAIEAESSKTGMAGDCPACGQSLHIPVSPTQFKLGSYQGTCTIGAGKEPVVSRLTLLVIRQENQIIHGNLKTTGELEVDSEFTGTATGDQIQFVTITPDKKLTVEWLAVIQGDSFRGTFSATDTGFWASVFGREHQHGEWQCTKERFPIIRRLKSFAKRVLAVVLVGVLALLILGASAIFNSGSTSSTAYSPSSPPSTTPLYQADQVPSTTAYHSPPQSYYYSPQLQSQPIERGYTPRVPPEVATALSRQIFDYTLQQKMVHVSAHDRGETHVQSYERQPPGGLTLGDKTDAAALAVGAAALLYGVDYVSWKYDQWNAQKKIEERKRTEEQNRAEMQRRIREAEEHEKQQKKKWWWQR